MRRPSRRKALKALALRGSGVTATNYQLNLALAPGTSGKRPYSKCDARETMTGAGCRLITYWPARSIFISGAHRDAHRPSRVRVAQDSDGCLAAITCARGFICSRLADMRQSTAARHTQGYAGLKPKTCSLPSSPRSRAAR